MVGVNGDMVSLELPVVSKSPGSKEAVGTGSCMVVFSLDSGLEQPV